MKVGIIGPDTQVRHIVELFENNKIEYSNLNLCFKNKNKYIDIARFVVEVVKVDVVYFIFSAYYYNTKIRIAKLFNKKVINHWIGSDILLAQKNDKYKKIQKYIDVNLACSPLIKEELYSMGIDAEDIPIIPAGLNTKYAKIPNKHQVLTYLPEGREEFYGIEAIRHLASKYKEINFNIVANTNKSLLDYDNVKFLGYVKLEDMDKIYDETSILIRLPEHDGLSLMLLEALLKGKEVIYTYDFPYVFTPQNLKDLELIFEKIIQQQPKRNSEAHEFVISNYNSDKILQNMIKIFKEV